jgi:hypothetical protein
MWDLAAYRRRVFNGDTMGRARTATGIFGDLSVAG